MRPNWTHGEQHMLESHGVTVSETTEALTDLNRVVIDPDPASQSGRSVRVVGWSHSRAHLVTVILVRDGNRLWGANGWTPTLRTVGDIARRRPDEDTPSEAADVRDLVQQEALAAEQNPDAPLQPGTKITRPGRARSTVYSVRLTPDEVTAIGEAANAVGVSASTLVRGWVLQGLAAQQEETPAAIVEQLAHDVDRLRRSLPETA